MSFGTPKTAAPGFSFGSSPAPGFGAQTQAQATGFSFGTPGPGATTTVAPSLSFGASAPVPAFGAPPTTSTGFAFGAPVAATAATTATTGFAFGASPVTSTAPTAFSSFGAPAKTTAQSGFSFGAPATTTSFAFGATPVPTTTQPLFGLAPTTSASLSFGTTTTAATGFGGLGSGSLFATTSQPAALPGASVFGTTTSAPAPAPSLGLGGIDVNASQPKSTEGKPDIKVKETQVPEQIVKTVEALKGYIKQQKSLSSDIARTSIRKLSNVSNEIQTLQWCLQEISNCVENNYSQIKILRSETAKTIQHAEMAQRTHETPVGLQFENIAPFQYFQELVQKYEADLITFRNQVELTEKHMSSLASPQSFSPDDLKKGLQQIHESFIALAGRLHEIHQKIEAQKEQYLNLRKYLLRDKTNVFAELESDGSKPNGSKISGGPTPFSSMSGMNLGKPPGAANQATGMLQQQNSANPLGTSGGFGLGQSTFGMSIQAPGTSLFSGSSSAGGVFGGGGLSATGSSFNLQKPPVGAKRNKQ